MLRLPAVVGVFSIVMVSCAPSDAPPRAFAVRDSAGVSIAENGRAVDAPAWCLAAAPSLVIGGDEMDPETQLYRAFSAALLPAGRIAVGNSGTQRVLVFDHEGRRVASLGTSGSGPGAFSPRVIRVRATSDGGILAENDGLQRKLVHFGSDGTFVDEIVLPKLPRGAWIYPVITADRSTFALFESMSDDNAMHEQAAMHEDVRRTPVALVRAGRDSTVIDTLAVYPGGEMFYADVGPQMAFGGGVIHGPRPIRPLFRADSRLTGGGDPSRVVVGDQATAAYDVYNEQGSLTQRVRWKADVRTPGNADVDSARNRFLESRRADRQGAQRSLAVMPAANRVPVFDELHVGRDNFVWVRQYLLPSDGRASWWIFADDGEMVGSLATPAGFELLETNGDSMLVRVTDEFDVERIELWEIDRHAPCEVE